MNNQNLTITMTGSLLMGAGLSQLTSTLGLVLIGSGALLQIIVALLQKKGIDIQSPVQEG